MYESRISALKDEIEDCRRQGSRWDTTSSFCASFHNI